MTQDQTAGFDGCRESTSRASVDMRASPQAVGFPVVGRPAAALPRSHANARQRRPVPHRPDSPVVHALGRLPPADGSPIWPNPGGDRPTERRSKA